MTQALATIPQNDAAIARRSDMSEWAAMREQATALVKSGFLPRAVDTPEKAIAIMQTGRELGIGPMQALRCIHILDAKPVMAAELIAGLVLARIPGALLRVVRTTADECVVHAARPGQEPTEFKWTTKDAEAAGLLNKQNWRSYRRAMLRNRCIVEAARATFPDATMGLYDPDELGAVTNERGEITVAAQPRAVSATSSVAESVMGDEPVEPQTEATPERLTFASLESRLKNIEDRVVYAATYDDALSVRVELGSRGKQSPLLRDMQDAGPEKRLISGPEYKALCKAWARCDRQLTKLEEKLKPSIEDSFTDPPDDEEPPDPEQDGR